MNMSMHQQDKILKFAASILEERTNELEHRESGKGIEPGTPIAEICCPSCGAELSVEHGDDVGEVAVISRGHGPR